MNRVVADTDVAATALLYDAPLVTHNRGDYLGVAGLSVVSHEA
jgi:predicted nucleic acid-binding protein